MRKKIWLFTKSYFMENSWNYKVIPNTETILMSVSSKLVLKKKIQVIPIGMFESFCFVFVKM